MTNPFPQSLESLSVDELVNLTLSESDEHLRWNPIHALHRRATVEVLNRCKRLLQSYCSHERQTGADILGQLGSIERVFPGECVSLLTEQLRKETDVVVVRSLLDALSHHKFEDTSAVRSFAHHENAEVRWSATTALIQHDDDASIETLIELTRDSDAHVRDWATFAIGSMTKLDTPAIRQALIDRLHDLDDDTRGEAHVGLALRGDLRVVDALKHELESGQIGSLTFEAIEYLADPSLIPVLVSFHESLVLQPDNEVLSAIEACRRGRPSPST